MKTPRTTERVHFRLIVTPCCHTMLCWVNPRFPTHCPECGTLIYPEVRGCVTHSDDNAILQVKYPDNQPQQRTEVSRKAEAAQIAQRKKWGET